MIRTLGLLAVLLAWAPAAPAETVKIGTTPAVTFVVLYAAEHLGYFKAEGLGCQFSDFEGGAEVTTAMVGGSIDFAGTYVERPMILAEKGFAAKNLLAIYNGKAKFTDAPMMGAAKAVQDLIQKTCRGFMIRSSVS